VILQEEEFAGLSAFYAYRRCAAMKVERRIVPKTVKSEAGRDVIDGEMFPNVFKNSRFLTYLFRVNTQHSIARPKRSVNKREK